MPSITWNQGERALCPDGKIRTVAFTGNGGWVYFYDDVAKTWNRDRVPAPHFHADELKIAPRTGVR